ncbi:uncharacterized protein LOC122653952 [Telopea speciosissima]|uniref:uncharacterized protein LOC122653952 n=1 Tax=Telopea speciosissima TaxID=54955 RepID=UPI001CC3ED5A|nr:uncharacterized protein LOC122653952 [Telopea speciosissima]
MERSSATLPSDSGSVVGAGGGGASKYLANLPSRGLFSSTVISSNPISSYTLQLFNPSDLLSVLYSAVVKSISHARSSYPHIYFHPEEQLIKTNQTNILIRSLTLKKQKSDSSSKDVKGKGTTESTKGKRAAERAVDGRASAKRVNMTNRSGNPKQEGTSTRTFERDFQGLTVERLRARLKERSLSVKGKKDVLIARLKGDRVDGEP